MFYQFFFFGKGGRVRRLRFYVPIFSFPFLEYQEAKCLKNKRIHRLGIFSLSSKLEMFYKKVDL